ncbi:MAG: hypothetical protein K0U98_02915 [Deltaproteobacteria bacterium]|nr:hypothetical protein [Deltaproteobacteria bacterium]
MKITWVRMPFALALLAILGWPQMAESTTLQRQGLDALVAHHETVVVAEVLDAFSYWNADGSMILTDVYIKTEQPLKGDRLTEELTVTLLGGSVGEITTLILGGAELVPGDTYLLFLNEENLLPGFSALTVREHSQGVFDVVERENGELRLVSQASSGGLLPDSRGNSAAPGGAEGLLLEEALRSIAALIEEGVKS